MPHRGRLNVLTQVMGKPYRALFHEFQGGSAKPDEVEGSGDVKYHLGASSDREFDGNKVHLSLTANPSHLEIVDPVVLGKARAKQDQHGATPDERTMVLPLLMHGDAAFAGQGVVAECFAMSGPEGLPHRRHHPFHRQQPDRLHHRAALFALFALSLRRRADGAGADLPRERRRSGSGGVLRAQSPPNSGMKFQKDVVIDMFCYRRFGHNEGDEPTFTQPLMYREIKEHPTTLEIYGKRLVGEGVVTEGEVDKMKADWRAQLDEEFEASQGYKPNKADWLDGRWAGLKAAREGEDPRRGETGVAIETLREIGKALTAVPEGFHVHKTIARLLATRKGDRDRRRHRLGDGRGAGLRHAARGGPSGAPVGPGLASAAPSRSATPSWSIRKTKSATCRSTMSAKARRGSKSSIRCCRKRPCWASNMAIPPPSRRRWRLWEAQFGDFANGAQVMIDQFIASGEMKWLRMSGLVMLLPHGYEGQGPEHSSARLERYLQLCAEDNMQVCEPAPRRPIISTSCAGRCTASSASR